MTNADYTPPWTTDSEISFLRGLGTFSTIGTKHLRGSKAAAARRAQLLAGYLAGAQQRTQWPRGLDKTQVLAFCQVQMVETA